MGKTIVQKHLTITDAQAVWQELSDHMRTSSKGASEKRRLTQYVTNTVLDDNFKGSTEQFVLEFNEPFRQIDEISDDSENFPPPVKLTLLQNAVRSTNDLIQFPPEMDENWVRYGLAKLGQISRTKLAEDAVLCVHNTASALNR